MTLNFFINGFGMSMDVTKEAYEHFNWMEGLEVHHKYPDCIRKWERDYEREQEAKLLAKNIFGRYEEAKVMATNLL